MTKRILIIEDEEELGQSLKRLLERQNFKVILSGDIKTVNDIREKKPDLIITDLLLPSVHGFDICKAIKSEEDLKDLPLIVMTAVYKDARSKLEALKIGVNDFIEKPFRLNELLKKIEKALGASTEETKSPTLSAQQRSKKNSNHKIPRNLPEEEIMETVNNKPSSGSDETLGSLSVEQEKERDFNIIKELQNLKQEETSLLSKLTLKIETLWEKIQNNQHRQERKKNLSDFYNLVNKLSVISTSNGFPEISQYAMQLELLVNMIIIEGENFISSRKNNIYDLLDKIRHHPIISTELEIIRQSERKLSNWK